MIATVLIGRAQRLTAYLTRAIANDAAPGPLS